MPKSVCKRCEVELKPETNGVIVAEMFRQNTKIYKLWEADLWRCPICKVDIVIGFANEPFALHFSHKCEDLVRLAIQSGRTVIYNKEII